MNNKRKYQLHTPTKTKSTTKRDALYSLLHFIRKRTADDENFLHSSERETFERPVQQRGIADREQALLPDLRLTYE